MIVKKIKAREIPRAVDIRDKLTVIAKSKRTLKNFASEKVSFQRAYESAQARGIGNACYTKLHKFRIWLAETDRVEDIDEMAPEIRNKSEFEVNKIEKRCRSLNRRLEAVHK